ncbi:MAG: hypothetical protein EA360_11050 [Balneolaceae bacterium]|nr:MAG: hypothetical protein EA360_11050 [Balneolaceae bacterium]
MRSGIADKNGRCRAPLFWSQGWISVWSLIFFYGMFALPDAGAQFINIQINVEPQVDTTVEQPLDFGQAISGVGFQNIPLGSPNMGIFQIRALRTQRLLLAIEIDDELVHEDPLIDARIPLNLSATYTDSGVNDYLQSVPFGSDLQTVIVNPPDQNPNAVWSSIFIYIFGDVNIAAVPVGVYRGEILLTIVYE